MASKVGAKPGEEIALTDKSYHTWAYTCLKDARILVSSAHPKHGRGYFLMTPNADKEPLFERIDCELAENGILDRVTQESRPQAIKRGMGDFRRFELYDLASDSKQ